MDTRRYLVLVLVLTGCLTGPTWAEDYVLNGESAELEPGQVFDNMTLANGATLTTYGKLQVHGKFSMEGNSKLLVKPFDESINGTGTLTLYASDVLIAEGSIISADAAGNDGRGSGYGGSYGGAGGNSGGSTYGTPGGNGVFMGSSGSSNAMGGGAILIVCQWFYMDGSAKISANGIHFNDNAGSGGGVLLNADALYILGTISALGAGAWYSGGGGRIKIHYMIKQIGNENQGISEAAEGLGVITAKGGTGYYDGKDGTIWFNHAPDPPQLIAPANSTTVSPRPTFQFSAQDHSDQYDGRGQPDQMRYRIELSQDDFQTILYNIDQTSRYVRGWVDETGVMQLWHDSGAEATYEMQEDLPVGTYQWRVFANDGKDSDPSEVQTFTVTQSSAVRITAISSDIGTPGQPVTLTGEGFVNGATVTFGDIPTADVRVVSSTQISLTVPSGNTGWVDIYVQTPDGSSATLLKAFRYLDLSSYTTALPVTKGLNILSLPLSSEPTYTASSLADALGSTIVIRADEGKFGAYVHENQIGTDFPIEMGKGYIVNLLEATTFTVTGQPWGVPAAPTLPASESWAFVVSGRVLGVVPSSASVRVTNQHSGQSLVKPVSRDGTFIGAFVDMSQQAVVAPGDVLTFEVVDTHGEVIARLPEQHITAEDIARAHLHVAFQANPPRTRLLPNFPNPLNPETWIPYTLAKSSEVTIEIYDIRGRLVRQMNLGYRDAGWYLSKSSAVYWDGRSNTREKVSSGLYFYHLQAGGFETTRCMLILK